MKPSTSIRSSSRSVPLRQLAVRLKSVVSKRKDEWKSSGKFLDFGKSSGVDSVNTTPASTPERPQNVKGSNDYVTIQDRDEICNWIHQTGKSLKVGSDSICLAYGVLDRVFSVLRVRRRLLKVLGAASLSLAIKYIEDENNQSYARFLCDSAGLAFSMRDLMRMELLILSKLDFMIQESTAVDFLFAFFDILAAGRDFPSTHQRKAISAFLVERLANFELARIPNMEVALGCIFVVFGGRGVSRLRLLLNLHGLQCDFQAAQEAARLLRPHSRISLKLVSKYLQLGEEEQRETDLLFSVKKLLSFGYLEPIPFGQKTFAEVARC